MVKPNQKQPPVIEAKVVRRLGVPPERVFDAWLEPDIVRRWMQASLTAFGLKGEMERVEIDARVGGRFTFSDGREGGGAVHWGTYLEIDRPRKLAFTWFTSAEEEAKNQSVVTMTLQPDGPGCTVTIQHRMSAEWAEYLGQTERGWGTMLDQTGILLASS